MNVSTPRRSSFRIRLLLVLAATSMGAAATAPQTARAADADSGQTVACMLPGQIHTVAGHPTMGARRPIQTSPADCRQRGGEYTVEEHASQPTPAPHVASVDNGKSINCLLPQQVRQLGEKARYTTARRPIRTTRSDCATRGGDAITSAQARKAARSYKASQSKAAAPKKQP